MKFYRFRTPLAQPDNKTYVQMVGYHTLEDAYHRLLERGEINLPVHKFDSFDFEPGSEPSPDELDNGSQVYGDDKYEVSAKLRSQDFATKPPVDLPKPAEPAPSNESAPASAE